MSVAAYFAREPAGARAQFLRACGTIGIAVATYRLPAVGGGAVDTLAARLGSPEARRLLILTPGSKAEDALCATGIGVACLRESVRRSVPRGVAMIFLHADEPSRILAPDTAQAADDAAKTPPRWTDSVLAAAESRYADYQRGRTSRMPVGDPVAEPGRVGAGAAFLALAAAELGNAERVAILDIATGTGAYGQCDVVAGHPAGSPGEARAGALFSARPLAAGSAASGMPGPFARGLVAATGEIETTVAAMAFGTYSVRAMVHSMLGQSAEGKPAPSGMFYPDAEDWKLAVWSGAAEVIRGALIGLDSG